MWDDESLENVHFTKVFTDVSLKEINTLERIYYGLIDYKLIIKGSEYSKYYFILRMAAEKLSGKFPLKPMNVEEMIDLQNKAVKVKKQMKERDETSRRTH